MTKLTSEQDAIKQAEEAGYNGFRNIPEARASILQDPSFWRALGKTREWVGNYDKASGIRTEVDEKGDGPITRWAKEKGILGIPAWQYHALRYFETLLSEGDMNKYWESLP